MAKVIINSYIKAGEVTSTKVTGSSLNILDLIKIGRLEREVNVWLINVTLFSPADLGNVWIL